MFQGTLKNRKLFLDLQLKQNTAAWGQQYPKSFGCIRNHLAKILLEVLGILDSFHAYLYCDNKYEIQIAVNPMYHECTKHIEINCHFTKEHMNARIVKQVM